MHSRIQKNKKIILLLAIQLSYVFASFSQTDTETFIIASGSRGGNYYRTGQYIAYQYNKNLPDYDFSVIETNGSNENIELLKNNVVDFAIVQRNILINNIYDEGKGTKNLAVIMPLFQEKLWIYFNGKESLNIKKINSLSRKKRLVIGFTSKNGYSYKIFKTLIKFLDIDYSNISEVQKNYDSLVSDFEHKKLDFIVSFSLPLRDLDTLENTKKMFLSFKDAKMIEKRVRNIYVAKINNSANQYTLGSWSFLIGAKNSIQHITSKNKLTTSLLKLSESIVHKDIYKRVKYSYDMFANNEHNEIRQLRNLPLSAALQSKMRLRLVNWQSYFVIFLLILASLGMYYMFKKKLLPKVNLLFFWHRYRHFQFGFILLILIYFSSVELLVYAEKSFYDNIGIKSQILNMTRQDLHSWLLVTTVTGNSNGIFPLSLLGKVMLALNSLNFWIGTILIGVSEFATYKMNKKRKQGLMKTRHTKHLVIFGWNTTAASFIAEIIKEAKLFNNIKINIVCVVPDIDAVRNSSKIISNMHDQKKIDIIQGDALDVHVLELSRVELANAVILLSEDRTKHADERTAMRAHAISRYTKKKKFQGMIYKTSLVDKVKTKLKKLTSDKKEPKYKRFKIEKTADSIYMIAELNNEEFRGSLIDADVNEIVVAGNYRKAIIKQSLFNHGISKVLDEIMQYNEHNEFYKIDLSLPENKHLQGKTFDELLLALRKQGILLIGIHIVFHDEDNNIIIDQNIIQQLLQQEENNITRDIIVNPVKEAEKKRLVDEDDHLIVLATNAKKLKEGIKKLKINKYE